MLDYLIYIAVITLCVVILFFYMRKLKKESQKVSTKIEYAIEAGLHEPVSMYPFIDPNTCIKSGACITACPEEDIIGIRDGRATLINASHCVGHGACFHACPVEAISLRIGTDRRGVDLPHVNQNFETNVQGIFIAGELGGMGLIKNSVEQGKQAVDHIYKSLHKNHSNQYDLIIIGAGPAGIAAALQANQYRMNVLVLEQDSVGGTVFNFPRAKVVMTAPMDLPGHGLLKLFNTSKTELLDLWQSLIRKYNIQIRENCKVDSIIFKENGFLVTSAKAEEFTADKVLLAIGRRGTPRKLGVPGEQLEKVWYKLMDPELINDKNILIVGGGDSAIESAILLANNNKVTLSYRGEKFNRLKPQNAENLKKSVEDQSVAVIFNSNVKEINMENVLIQVGDEMNDLPNDLVYVFAGGELPTKFLENAGIKITKRFNYTLLSHQRK